MHFADRCFERKNAVGSRAEKPNVVPVELVQHWLMSPAHLLGNACDMEIMNAPPSEICLVPGYLPLPR
jgi:hypothetical protein